MDNLGCIERANLKINKGEKDGGCDDIAHLVEGLL